MVTAAFRQNLIEVLAQRWHAGQRAIDSSLLHELLLHNGYLVSTAHVVTLLQEWEARELIQLGTVHKAGRGTPRRCTVFWISDTLLASAWAKSA